MDPEGIKVIGSLIIYFGGIFAGALAWEILRTVLFGIMLLFVLKKRKEYGVEPCGRKQKSSRLRLRDR